MMSTWKVKKSYLYVPQKRRKKVHLCIFLSISEEASALFSNIKLSIFLRASSVTDPLLKFLFSFHLFRNFPRDEINQTEPSPFWLKVFSLVCNFWNVLVLVFFIRRPWKKVNRWFIKCIRQPSQKCYFCVVMTAMTYII